MCWLIPDRLASRYAAASGCSMKPLSSFFPEQKLYVARNGKATLTPHTWRGWANRAWKNTLFGSGILPDSSFPYFVAWLMFSPRACPAPLTATQAAEKATRTREHLATAAARLTIASGSSKSVAPPWCFSRTSQLGFEGLGTSEAEKSTIHSWQLEQNYQDWVTRSLSLSLSLRTMLGQRTSGNESLCWPTATARMESGANNHYQHGCPKAGKQLQEEAANWQTPRSHEAGAFTRDHGIAGQERESLTGQAENWPSPNASGANDGEDLESWEARKKRNLEKGINGNGMGTPLSIAAQKWATPDAPTGGSRTRSPEAMAGGAHKTGAKMQVTLQDQASIWATPRAADGESGPDLAKEDRSNTGIALPAQASKWPSPRAEDSESIGNHPGASDSLHAATQNWPTVTTQDGEQAGGRGREERRGKTTLSLATEKWPTCQSRDSKSGETLKEYGNSRPLTEAVLSFSPPGPPTGDGPRSSKGPPGSRPRLNPAFALWLMGAPWFWTRAGSISFGASVTQSWRLRQRLLLWNFFHERGSNE